MVRADVQYYADALARDLGIKPGGLSSREAILAYVDRKIESFLREIPCERLGDLLCFVANKVGTRFEIIKRDEDLVDLRSKYVRRREPGFVQLENLLNDESSFGLTIRLQKPRAGELQFVSIIDGRGEKAFREYFTKWHEIGHLLILTQQQRLLFRRTHEERKDPEEILVDAIAGRVGFYPPLVRPYLRQPLDLDALDEFHQTRCPEASRDATIIGIINALDEPLLYLQARPGVKKKHRDQLSLIPRETQLRVRTLRNNQPAIKAGLIIHDNMRVPKQSIIHRIHNGEVTEGTAAENLDWWESSGGGRLRAIPIRVNARVRGPMTEAIVSFPEECNAKKNEQSSFES